MSGVLITEILMSQHVIAKINQKHHLAEDDVIDAVDRHTEASWVEDSERGLRLFVTGTTQGGRTVRIVLYPDDIEAGTFRLGTAF